MRRADAGYWLRASTEQILTERTIEEAALTEGRFDRARMVLGCPDFRVLLAARFASQIAEGVCLAVIFNAVVFLPESQSTVRGFAVATALSLLPFALLEPFAGVFVDRWPRRPILVALPLVRAAAALLALPGIGGGAVYAGALIVFSANRLFQATTAAVIPRVVGAAEDPVPKLGQAPDDTLLFTANTIASIVGTVALFGGISAGGFVATAAGTWAVIALSGAL